MDVFIIIQGENRIIIHIPRYPVHTHIYICYTWCALIIATMLKGHTTETTILLYLMYTFKVGTENVKPIEYERVNINNKQSGFVINNLIKPPIVRQLSKTGKH